MEENKLVLLDDEPECLKFFVEEGSKIFVNGGMEFGCFFLPEDSALKSYIRPYTIKADLFYELITSKEFWEKFPHLILHPKYDISGDIGFIFIPSLLLDGEFAAILHHGGAYERIEDPLKAKKMGNDLVRCLFQERYDDLICYRSPENWADDEENILIQISYVIFDMKFSKIWFISITDID